MTNAAEGTGIAMTQRKPICVVIDTNIWRSELLLKSAVGETFVYTLGRQGGFIGLPEVIEMELTKHGVQIIREAAQKHAEWSRRLKMLTDWSWPVCDLTQDQMDAEVEKRISSLEKIVVRRPFTLEHAKAALQMVNAELPPNGPNDQQFKDSLLWQVVLDLTRDYTVHLVTNDRAFLLDRRDPSKGLASNLQGECKQLLIEVPVFVDLGTCLKAITSDVPPFDKPRLTQLALPIVQSTLETEGRRYDYTVGEFLESRIEAFRTRQAGRLAVDYKIVLRFIPSRPPVSTATEFDCRAVAHGSYYYNLESDSLDSLTIDCITFGWRSSGGSGVYSRSFESNDDSRPFFRRIDSWDW